MFGGYRTHDNAQTIELQGLNKRVGATDYETHGDRSSLEDTSNSRNVRSRGRFWQWLLEILSLVGALLLLCAIVGLLVGYHDNKQPVWRYSINLNSLVALLSTLFKALMMIAVAEAISQCKWMWYQQPRSLDQLATFDTASRGAWGSLVLIAKIPKSRFAFLGAVITVLSVGVNTFTQQSIKTYACDKPLSGVEAMIPVARYVSMGTNRDVASLDSVYSTGLNIKIKTRILNGLANADISLDPPTTCQTGNCTFNENAAPQVYHSVGFCHQCWNSAADLKDDVAGKYTGWSELPNGMLVGKPDSITYTVLNISTSASFSWLSAANEPASESIMLASGTNMTILSKSNVACQDAQGHQHSASNYTNCYVAASCVMYPCLKTYTGSITNGKLLEDIDHAVPMFKVDMDSPVVESSGVGWPCNADGETYDAKNISTAASKNHSSLQRVRLEDGTLSEVPSQCVYTMDYAYRGAITSYLASLQGGCSERRANPNSLFCEDEDNIELFYNGGNATFQTIDDGLERVTKTITTRMREIGVQSKNISTPSFVTGTAQQTFVCTRFEWYWLLMPATLLLATALLLTAVILGGLFNRQSPPIWKSSVLPLLVHGPDSVRKADDQMGDGIAAMTKVAKSTRVTLQKDENGTWKLLRDDGST